MSDWQLDGYAQVEVLGSGGFGHVVLAKHQASGSLVAIKHLHRRFLADPDVVDAFRREAVLLSSVRSPYVAGVYDFVQRPDGAALVMEAVPGVSLKSVLAAEGALAPEAALAVLKGSLLGLAAAHSAGVVHRDYKPDNVLVDEHGRSRLVDFGLAVLDGQQGLAAGSPAYMAPEQWAGYPAGPATDVYAATCVFFQCVTGSRPYDADTSAEYKALHEQAPVPVADVPSELQGLVARGMAKFPAQRPASAYDFVTELEAAAVAGYGEGWEQRGWRQLAAGAAALLALAPVALLVTAGTVAPTTGAAVAGAGATGAAAAGVGTAGTALAAKLALALLVVVGLTVGGVVIFTGESDEPPRLTASVRTLTGPVGQPPVVRHMEYVQISGHPDPAVQKRLNAALRKPIDDYVDNAVSSVEGWADTVPATDYEEDVEVHGDAEITRRTDDILSVKYGYEIRNFPTNNPTSWMVPDGLTLDLRTGTLLGPRDIFRESALTADGMRTLAERGERAMGHEWCEVILIDEPSVPAMPDGSSSEHWDGKHEPKGSLWFTADGMTYWVYPAEVHCANAAGPQVFSLPYSQVADLLRPEFLQDLGVDATASIAAAPQSTTSSSTAPTTSSAQSPDGVPLEAGPLTLRMPEGWATQPQGLETSVVDGNNCADVEKYYDCPRFLVTDNRKASDEQPRYEPGGPYVRSAVGRRCNAIGRKDLAQEGEAELTESADVEVAGLPARRETWTVQCVEPGSGEQQGEPLTQRIWYVPSEKVAVLDEFDTPGLNEALRDATLR